MPMVGNKKFPYTPSGMKRAQQAMKRQQNPIASKMRQAQNRQRFAGALDRLRSDRTLTERAQNLRPVNQVRAMGSPDTPNQRVQPTPNRRQQIVGQVKQDKMYRPDRDGPKRRVSVLPVPRPKPGPVDPGFYKPKPPARPGMRPSPPFGKRPGGGRRPNPKKRYPRLLPGRGLGKYL